MAPQTFSIIRQVIALLLLIILVSGVVSAKARMAPLCPRTHLDRADKISELLKITSDNFWIISGISSNGKSKHVENFKKKAENVTNQQRFCF